jgi:NodT family efflux transporter outer membrane factor (OMF) lipoprotein
MCLFTTSFHELTRMSRARKTGTATAVWASVALLALGGCATVGPDYVAPDARAPAQWSAELKAGVSSAQSDPQALARWWTVLDDPLLAGLVERSLEGNLDLRQAQARVREARARRGVAAADRFPTITTGVAATRASGSRETGLGLTNELYSAGFDASWELDVFGGKRRATEAAQAQLEASVEDTRDVLVTLFAEVALNYVEVRSFQTRLSLAEENLRSQSETYDITRWRRQAGLTTQLDVERARFNLEQTRAQIPVLQTGLAQARHRLAVLLGQAPGALAAELTESQAIPSARVELAVGVPADVLRRRPDVRRAERQLAAQTAQVGVATAARYPSFSLLGSIGLEALAPGRLLSSAATSSLIGGNVNWTLFDAGRLRQNIQVQTALQEQALIGYEAAVLGALQEVEDVLVAYAEEQARRESLRLATQSAKAAADLAQQQYAAGLIDFQAVLDAQRSLLSLQDQLATSEGEVTSNLIRLYKALGGGWVSLNPATSQPAAQKE